VFLAAALIPSGPAAASVLEGDPFCGSAVGAERRACVTQWVAAHPPSVESLELLTARLASDPVLVADAVDRYGFTGEQPTDPALTADLLDLRAAALATSGDLDGAAVTMALAVRHDDGTRRLAWVRPGGEIGWSTSVDAGNRRLLVAARRMLDAGRKPEARPLLARAAALGSDPAIDLWRVAYPGEAPPVDWPGDPLRQVAWGPAVPELSVPLFDGQTFSLHGEGVLLIDFWASWCYPCRKELPSLQALYDAQKDAGLRAVAVNVNEPADVAVPAAEELGLTLPLGQYTPGLASAFRVDNLPTVIVADHHGKVRRRWNGYRDGIEQDVSETVRGLLYEAGGAEIVELASVLRNDLALEVSWVRNGPRPVQAVAVLPASATEAGAIAVASRDDLVLLENDGAVRAQYAVSFDANQLRRLQDTADGRRVAAFRRGGDQVFFLRPADGDSWSGTAPSALLDLRAAPSQGQTATLLATLDGPVVWDGDRTRSLDTPDRALAVIDPAGAGAAWAVLDGGRSIVWLDGAFAPGARSVPVPAASQLVVARGAAGVGVLPAGLLGAASGRAAAGDWIAVAAPDQLVVLDAGTGQELFRAKWQGLSAVASGDVDGDGRDDLAVGSGTRVSLLRVSGGGPPPDEDSGPR